MTRYYDFKDQVILDVKNYIAGHKEIDPLNDFESAVVTLELEFGASDPDSNKMVKDTVYEVLEEYVNDIAETKIVYIVMRDKNWEIKAIKEFDSAKDAWKYAKQTCGRRYKYAKENDHIPYNIYYDEKSARCGFSEHKDGTSVKYYVIKKETPIEGKTNVLHY